MGNDHLFAIYFNTSMSAYLKGRLLEVMRNVYDPDDIAMYRTTDALQNDVRVYESDYGGAFVGLTECTPGEPIPTGTASPRT